MPALSEVFTGRVTSRSPDPFEGIRPGYSIFDRTRHVPPSLVRFREEPYDGRYRDAGDRGNYLWLCRSVREDSEMLLLQETVPTLSTGRNFGLFKKVEARIFNGRYGFFPQPHFIDCAGMFDRSEPVQPAIRVLESPWPENFPDPEIIRKITSALQSHSGVIIGNGETRFVLTGASEVSIETRNAEIALLFEGCKFIRSIEGRIETFLRSLPSLFLPPVSGFVQPPVPAALQDLVVDHLLSYPDPVYIKPGCGPGQGRWVYRMEKAGSRILFQTDSSGYAEHFRIALRRLAFCRGMKNAFTEDERCVWANTPEFHAAAIRALLASMPSPFIETEIPCMRSKNGERVEFRNICHDLPGTCRHTVEACYCKVSGNSIAANIALGGSGGIPVEELKKLYGTVYPGHSDRFLQERAEDAYARMTAACEAYARAFSSFVSSSVKILPQIIFQPVFWHDLRDFAVDIAPVWNAEKDRIDFALIEVQIGYNCSGLRDTQPQAYERVRRNQTEIIGRERFDKLGGSVRNDTRYLYY